MVWLLSPLVAVPLRFLVGRNSGIPPWISSPRNGVSWFTTSRGLGFGKRTCIMGGFDRLCMKGTPLDPFDYFWPLCTAHPDQDPNTRKFKEIISGYLYKWNNQFLFQRPWPLRKFASLVMADLWWHEGESWQCCPSLAVYWYIWSSAVYELFNVLSVHNVLVIRAINSCS